MADFFGQIFKVDRKTFFDPKAWIDVNSLRTDTKVVADGVKTLLTVPEPKRQETFTAALKRLNIKEEDLPQIQRNFLAYCAFFVILGAIIFIFSFYIIFFKHSFSGFLLGLSISLLSFAQAFRYHFWLFQMKYRKLGCTFTEWRQGKPNDNGEVS